MLNYMRGDRDVKIRRGRAAGKRRAHFAIIAV